MSAYDQNNPIEEKSFSTYVPAVEYIPTLTEGRESAESRIRYKIEEYQSKAEELQALLDVLEAVGKPYALNPKRLDKAGRILHEMVCSLK